jgi:hypothetical protein
MFQIEINEMIVAIGLKACYNTTHRGEKNHEGEYNIR